MNEVSNGHGIAVMSQRNATQRISFSSLGRAPGGVTEAQSLNRKLATMSAGHWWSQYWLSIDCVTHKTVVTFC